MNLDGFLAEYGFTLTVLALGIILLIGLFKIVAKKLLDKVEKENRKPIYELLTIVLVIVLTVLWIAIEPQISGGAMVWGEFLPRVLALYSVVKVMYPVYENFKLRDLVHLLGDTVRNKIEEKHQKKQIDKGE